MTSLERAMLVGGVSGFVGFLASRVAGLPMLIERFTGIKNVEDFVIGIMAGAFIGLCVWRMGQNGEPAQKTRKIITQSPREKDSIV